MKNKVDYAYKIMNNEVEITKYKGCSINVIIPSKINGLSVTSIGYHAFGSCIRLTSITIPDSVTSIGDSAFNWCKSLTSITIPDSVTSIGKCAFSECTSLKSITIPDSVTSIGDWAFSECTSLKSITIPDSVTSIGDSAFNWCKSLTSITIPDSVTSIEGDAFCETKLKSEKDHYKAFELVKGGIQCRGYKYKLNEWSDVIEDIVPCRRGYHYCDNIFNIFNYYSGEYGKDFVIGICEVGNVTIPYEDKFVTNKIKPIKLLSREEVINLMNNN